MISVIGAVNVDITAKSNTTFIHADSNPGKVKITVGGVGRNIACNLGKLSQDVTFYTVFGNDDYSVIAKANCIKHGLNIENALDVEKNSSYYVCITDENGEMQSAVADMDVVNYLTKEYISENIDKINKSDVVVFDTNLTEETLQYIMENIKAPLYSDAVSCKKAIKLKNIYGNGTMLNIHTLKANILEAEVISGISINNDEELLEASKIIHDMGVKNVCITRGVKGSSIYDGKEMISINAKSIKPVNATGAGDSFLAALVYSHMKQFDKKTSLLIGSIVSAETLMSSESVNPMLNEKSILEKAGICQ